jgi:hypothetical protein
MSTNLGVVPVKESKHVEPGGDVNSGPSKVSPESRLNHCARLARTELDDEKVMFLRFDAWTDPRLRDWIERNPNLLTLEARKLFYDDRPTIDVDVLRCAFELLTRLPVDRAMTVAANKTYGVEARVGGRARLQLDALGFSYSKLIETLAEYLHKILSPKYRFDAKPSKALDLLFVHFATGNLKIEPGRHEWLNAEPDSAYFFAFAEFCIQAAQIEASPGRSWWVDLGGLFAALQDVYCLRYHRKGAERRFSTYQDRWCNRSREIDDDVLQRHIESVRQRDDEVKKLVERVTWNAFWYFFDDVQELSGEEKRSRAKRELARNEEKRLAIRKLLRTRGASRRSRSSPNSLLKSRK